MNKQVIKSPIQFIAPLIAPFIQQPITLLMALILLAGCQAEDETSPARDNNDDATFGAPERAANEKPNISPEAEKQAVEAEDVSKFALIKSALAEIQPASGSEVSGKVRFRPDPEMKRMLVTVNLRGLTPGKHGFHIHESGDCSAKDASSAGEHFNPFDAKHGSPQDEDYHLGDMGNIEADAQGEVNSQLSFKAMSFSGPNSVLQKALIVHADADDMTSQPSGNAGDRIGCGEIIEEKDVLIDKADKSTAVPAK